MIKDPIVEEVRKERDAHAARFNYDLNAIYEDIKKKEKENIRKLITLPPRYAQKSA